jgi:hypothetical protein
MCLAQRFDGERHLLVQLRHRHPVSYPNHQAPLCKVLASLPVHASTHGPNNYTSHGALKFVSCSFPHISKDVKCVVAGVPKSIDNDILLIDKCFGFDTAVEEAQRALLAAKVCVLALPAAAVLAGVTASSFLAMLCCSPNWRLHPLPTYPAALPLASAPIRCLVTLLTQAPAP